MLPDFSQLGYPERFREIVSRWHDQTVVTTSAGAQSAVMLSLVHQFTPDTPVVFIDTGYHFPETYRFFAELRERFPLDYRIYTPTISAAHLEATHGQLWEQGPDGLEKYGLLTKVEPMNRAISELGRKVWLSGLRRSQSSARAKRPFIEQQKETIKVYPILDWSDEDIYTYMMLHDLPMHPLVEKGYVSIGDWHSTRPLESGLAPEQTRFHGIKRECGLHLESKEADFVI